MPTAETEQMEMTITPDTPLGKACKEFLAVQEKKKDAEEDVKDAAKKVMGELAKEGRSSVRFSGWEFEIDTPDQKLKCHPVKGKAEAKK